jgi:succinoglycan biosynthesis transport protein ExoP
MEQKPVMIEQMEEIDLREYIEVILKWKWMIILLTVGCILSSFIISTFVLTPVYETKAVLMVTQPTSERVYREDGSLESTVNSMSRLPELTLNMFSSQFENAEILSNVIEKLGLEEKGYSVQSLDQQVTVTPNGDNNVLNITVRNTDPLLAKSIANTLVDEFFAFISVSNQQQLKDSVNLLTIKLQETEEELKKAAESYYADKSRARNAEIIQKELTNKIAILDNSRTRLLESQVELEQLTAAKKRMEENLADTPVKLVTRRAYLGESALSEEASTIPEEEILGDGNYVTEEMNPLYLELIKSLNEKDAVIAQTEARIAGMEKSISMLEYEVAELQKEYSTREMEENTLRRKLDTLENTYAILNEKIIQTEITKSVDFGRINFTLVSPAFYPSSPVKPKKSLNVAVAALAGLLLSVLLAFVLEFFDDTVKTPEDLKKIWDLPVMATIPGTKQ